MGVFLPNVKGFCLSADGRIASGSRPSDRLLEFDRTHQGTGRLFSSARCRKQTTIDGIEAWRRRVEAEPAPVARDDTNGFFADLDHVDVEHGFLPSAADKPVLKTGKKVNGR